MTENQKLREALHKAKAALSLALSDVDWRKDSLTQPVIHKAYNCAHEALAMPTADHLPDAGEMVVDHFPDATKMIETAVPVGEQEVFEREMMDKYGWQRNDFKLDDFGYADGQTDTAWMAWQARAALSAGDAVDAQRLDFIEKSARCDPKMDGQHVWWPTSLNKALKGPTLRAAIDAAMRKDKT